jgi:hypothetical protein
MENKVEDYIPLRQKSMRHSQKTESFHQKLFCSPLKEKFYISTFVRSKTLFERIFKEKSRNWRNCCIGINEKCSSYKNIYKKYSNKYIYKINPCFEVELSISDCGENLVSCCNY